MTYILFDKPKIRWSSALPNALAAYNSLPHCATGFAPKTLHFGIRIPPDSSLSNMLAKAVKSRQRQKDTQLAYAYKHAASQLEIGTLVLVKVPPNHPLLTKLSPQFEGPFEVVDRRHRDTYQLRRCHGTNHHKAVLPDDAVVNASRLRHYFSRSAFDSFYEI